MKKAAGTAGWRRWTSEEDARLEQLWRHDLFDEEIALEVGRTAKAIRLRRERLGLTVDMYVPESRELFDNAVFPTFEDITKEEARKICADAPRSAKWSRDSPYSLTGSTAELCAENELWKRAPRKL